MIKMFGVYTFLLLLLPGKSFAATIADDLLVKPKMPRLSQSDLHKKRHVTINQQKFELISKQEDHWLLYDSQLGQYCIALNQLVVVTTGLEGVMRKVGLPFQPQQWQVLAKDTYRWSGSLNLLSEMQRKLKSVPDTHIEWQLQYLPLSRASEF